MKCSGFVTLARMCVWGSMVAVATMTSLAWSQAVTVVEYRNKTLDAYFITGRVAEQQLLDTVADFSRTGMTFQASAASTAPSALTRICRFYVNLASPFVNSHFYGRQGTDCESILGANPAGFSYEGYDFAVQASTPGIGVGLTVEEVCPAGLTPVRRSFRALTNGPNGKTSNHRYTVSQATATSAAAAGYVVEGVQFCVTLATDATPVTSLTPPLKWVGVGASSSGASSSSSLYTASAQVTWSLESYVSGIATYRPSGTVEVTAACISYAPSSGPIDPTSGVMFVDYNSFPPTYHGSAVAPIPTVATFICNSPPYSVATYAPGAFFGGSKGTLGVEAQGTVSADGLTIEGTDTGGDVRFNWYFARR